MLAKSCVSSLAIKSFNMAVNLFNKKLYVLPMPAVSIEESCRSCHGMPSLVTAGAGSIKVLAVETQAEVLL